MLIGTVVHPVVCDAVIEELRGFPLVNVSILSSDSVQRSLVAVDVVGAGAGATVLVAEGDAARLAVHNLSAPIEAAVVGLLGRPLDVKP